MTWSNSDAIDGQGVWRSNAYTITAFYYPHPERGFFRRASRLAAIGPSVACVGAVERAERCCS